MEYSGASPVFTKVSADIMNIIINAFSARLGGGQTYLINLLNNLPVDQDVKIGIFAKKLKNLG